MPTSISFADSPLKMVDFLFDCHLVKGEKSMEEVKQIVQKQFETEFSDSAAYFKIPSINIQTNAFLKPNSLVRFRCMIQDMKDPEYFHPYIKVEHKQKPGFEVRCGLFRDTVDCAPDDEFLLSPDKNHSPLERHVFNCVPIPAETFWVKNYWFNVENNKMDEILTQEAATSREKRERDDSDDDESRMETSICDVEKNASVKKSRVENPLPLNEIKSETINSCCVKVYSDGDSFKLNDMVEFAGIFVRSVEDNSPPADSSDEDKFQLHALYARKLNHANPNLYDDQKTSEELMQTKSIAIKEIREKLHKYLTFRLLGDELAAELLICNLISFVTHKDAMPLGKFTLNLYNVPSDAFVKNLFDTLCRFLTKCLYLPLSLTDLNGQKFLPQKDYEKNCLTTGRLQLTNGTCLVVDETKLEAGQLIDQGVRNIAALQSVISHQKLDYDFRYHCVEFRTDLNVIILSEGLSCLPSDCALPMKLSFTPANFCVDQTEEENLLQCFRDYLTLIRFPEFKIDDAMQQKIREDFVEMRRKNDVNQMKLHELLVLARWVSFSYGTSCLNEELWERTKSMDEARRERVLAK